MIQALDPANLDPATKVEAISFIERDTSSYS
jgi:hypothetical protein